MVAACDQPWLTGEVIAALVAAVRDPAAAVAVVLTADGPAPFPLAARVAAARPLAEAAFAAGGRSMRALLDAASRAGALVTVAGLDPAALADVDRPAEGYG